MGDLVAAFAAFYGSRVVDDIPVMFSWMEVCFDFQSIHQNKQVAVMVLQRGITATLEKSRKHALCKLYLWATDIGKVKLPSFEVIHQQYCVMVDRLISADRRRKAAWSGETGKVLGAGGKMVASSRVIVADLFTKSDLYTGIHDLLYLLNHCILKTINEAVVESMGCCVDVHASGKRGLSAEKYSMEAVIDRNGPPLAQADSLIKNALDSYFAEHNGTQGGGTWHFKHVRLGGKFQAKSKVCVAESQTKAKLPFVCDVGNDR